MPEADREESCMDIRYSVHPDHAKHFTTEELREKFHIGQLFVPGKLRAVYVHDDRVVVIGVVPLNTSISINKEIDCCRNLGTGYFLERREMGIINIGGPGYVKLDGETYSLGNLDGLYVSMGTHDIIFESETVDKPAEFYAVSVPAHRAYLSRLVTLEQTNKVLAGDPVSCNERITYQYFHPAVLKTNQLLMGYTQMKEGSVWMTMPPHLHERRMEVYFYCNMNPDEICFHIMGAPDETRHLVMKNRDAVIAPSWSIHSAVGTSCYGLIWSMAGENINYADMDMVKKTDLL